MATSTQWRNRPVFVSSTFRDMQAERDHLRNVVFPRIEADLAKRRYHLEPVDLRWGVETGKFKTEEDREKHVLKVCLNDIERSRPFLIVLMGDRYGWVPPEKRMRVAVKEKGFDTDIKGKSVTALEIEFGILKSPEQKKRSFFYFRKPLPYEKMPREVAADYSDDYAKGKDFGAASKKKYEELTEEIRAKIEPKRIRDYEVAWDEKANRINQESLKTWGEQVYQDIWNELEEETREFEASEGITWQEQERLALEEFLELRSRGFSGRTAVRQKIMDFTLSNKAEEGNIMYVTGGPGTGKSALFARVTRELKEKEERDKNILVLAHAAGISVKSDNIDALIRRWIEELSKFLGVPDNSAEIDDPEEKQKILARLLTGAAQQRRVVILVDALNQFERSVTARHLTWLPDHLHTNVRMICTVISGEETKALAKRKDTCEFELPLLEQQDAAEIAVTLCCRLHKELPSIVITALSEKKLEGGTTLAAGNPLWLTIAIEQLLLLDEDDFAAAGKLEGNDEGEKLRNMMKNTVDAFPPTVQELYGFLLKKAEKAFGRGFVCAVVDLIAAGRKGLRIQDLKELVPQLNNEEWDDLNFSVLQRYLRAHLVQREKNLWDYTHLQLRVFLENDRLAGESYRKDLHRSIVAHMETLPSEDMLKQTEIMHHYMQSDEKQRAARYIGSNPTQAEKTGSAKALADSIAAGDNRDINPELVWTLVLLKQKGIEEDAVEKICRFFNFDLSKSMANNVKLKTRIKVFEENKSVLEDLNKKGAGNAKVARNLSLSYSEMGDLTVQLGDTERALGYYHNALKISEDLYKKDHGDTLSAKDVSIIYSKLGDLTVQLGDTERALEYYHNDLKISKDLYINDPGDTQAARDISAGYESLGRLIARLGDTKRGLDYYNHALKIRRYLHKKDLGNAEAARDLYVTYINLGDLTVQLGDTEGALEYYHNTLEISEDLHKKDPGDAKAARDLSAGYGRLGDLTVQLGDTERALEYYHNTLEISEDLHKKDPNDTQAARDLSVDYSRLGDLTAQRGDTKRGLDYYHNAMKIRRYLHKKDLGNAEAARDLSTIYRELGNLTVKLGDTERGLDYYHNALKISEDLHKKNPGDTQAARDLYISYINLGDLTVKLGDTERGLEYYHNALKISEDLHKKNPGNTQAARDLSISYSRLGDQTVKLGDTERGLDYYHNALKISEDLHKKDPGDAQAARDLSAGYGRIGSLTVELGDTERGLGYYHNALKISEDLHEKDPGDAQAARDLSVSYVNWGDLKVKLGDTERGLDYYHNALKIREDLHEKDPDDAQAAKDIAQSYYKLAVFSRNQRDDAKLLIYAKLCRNALLYMKEKGMYIDPWWLQVHEQLEEMYG